MFFHNTLALLINNPQRIVCFDYNIVQINLAKLKICAFKNLDYDNLLKFLGINSTKKERIKLYNDLKEYLEIDVLKYFNENVDIIKTGLVYCGKFEYYLSLFKKYIP